MLFANRTAREKREELRGQLSSGELLRFPGAFSPLVALLVERLGFDGVYVSGAGIANDLGLPDVGLTTASEVGGRAGAIARATDLPAIVDVDTGFGEPLNVARTVRELEDLGLAGCHLEDQVTPKRCGHLDNKQVIAVDEAARKVAAAVRARRDRNFLVVARTDARHVEGLAAAIRRARAYVEAGADVIFPEALEDEREFAAFRDALDVPLLANITEFGRTPLLGVERLRELGYNLVIYPLTALRLAMGAVERGLRELRDAGTQEHLLPRMQTRGELYELLRYAEYGRFDQRVADFEPEG